jgi:tRNA (Thr-GGU) A37 N-methylase
MFTSQPIGFVSSPYKDTKEIPRGLGAKHDMDGVLKILPAFELGLTDIEGFSHLFVIWEFDRAPGRSCAGLICWLRRLLTIGRMGCLRLDLRDVRIQLV